MSETHPGSSRAERMFKGTVGVFLLLAGAAFLAINSYILASGAAKFGYSDADKIAYAAAAAIVPWVIAVLPLIVNQTWKQTIFGLRRPSVGTAAIAFVWVLFIAYNLTNGAGSIASARTEVVASREHDNGTLLADKERRTSLLEEAKGIPQSRPSAAVAALIAGEKVKKPWEWSSSCTDPRSKSQRTFCIELQKLEAEQLSASRRDEINAEVGELNAKIESTGATVGAAADPQTDLLWRFSCTFGCVEKEQITLWTSASTPIVLEVGAAMMWAFAATLFGFNLHRATSSGPHRPPPIPEMPKPILVQRERMESAANFVTNRELDERNRICDSFFAQWLVPSPDGSLSERDWFEHYEHYCRLVNAIPVTEERFRRIAAKYVPSMTLLDGEYAYFGCLPVMPKDMRRRTEKQAAE